jgi:hypothetical protein
LEVWSTAPILDLLLLGSCKEIAPKTLLDLVTVLVPYLRSSREGDVEGRDRGPWGGEPARLLLPADLFEFADCTEGQTSYGPYTVSCITEPPE